jgi:hypothetical protein
MQIVPVHHTRDSFTKEWLDTLDKALRGWATFLRPMLKSVMHLPCFRADWFTLMGVLQDLITMHTLPSNAGSRKVLSAYSIAFASPSFQSMAVVASRHLNSHA